MKCILICGLLLSSHYYLQFNQNVALLSPCCCIMCADLRASQGSTPTMQYAPPCQYLIWMLAGRPSFSQPTTESAIRATQQPSGISCPSEYILRSLICFCANVGIAIVFVFPLNTRTLTVSFWIWVLWDIHSDHVHISQGDVSDIMCLEHVAYNLGCGHLMPPPEIDSLDEGSHPSAAGPHKSCLTRPRNEEFVPQIRVLASLKSKEMKGKNCFWYQEEVAQFLQGLKNWK